MTGEVRPEKENQQVPTPSDRKSAGSAVRDSSCALEISLTWKFHSNLVDMKLKRFTITSPTLKEIGLNPRREGRA